MIENYKVIATLDQLMSVGVDRDLEGVIGEFTKDYKDGYAEIKFEFAIPFALRGKTTLTESYSIPWRMLEKQ